LFKISREFGVDYSPPFSIVVLIKVFVVEHKIPDIFNPLSFFVSALASCVPTITVRAEFGDSRVVDSDSTSVHWKKLRNRGSQLHLDRVSAISFSFSFRVGVIADIFSDRSKELTERLEALFDLILSEKVLTPFNLDPPDIVF
jgi:hypothetical protein